MCQLSPAQAKMFSKCLNFQKRKLLVTFLTNKSFPFVGPQPSCKLFLLQTSQTSQSYFGNIFDTLMLQCSLNMNCFSLRLLYGLILATHCLLCITFFIHFKPYLFQVDLNRSFPTFFDLINAKNPKILYKNREPETKVTLFLENLSF